jgi:hypothetical protein
MSRKRISSFSVRLSSLPRATSRSGWQGALNGRADGARNIVKGNCRDAAVGISQRDRQWKGCESPQQRGATMRIAAEDKRRTKDA